MKSSAIILLVLINGYANAQLSDSAVITMQETVDSLPPINYNALPAASKTHLRAKALIFPLTFLGYGFSALNSGELKQLDKSTKNEIREHHQGQVTSIDNYLQYAPAIAVYALNASGIKGKNNFRDRSMIYGISTLLVTASVTTIKDITKRERPDGSANNSFPSGHTATAFAAAEFLRQEYKDVSPWYGIGGYVAATTTGIMRLYNNKHWVSDIVAGAGLGILCTRATYWVYPAIQRKLFKNHPVNTAVLPFYQPHGGGLCLVSNFGHSAKHIQ